MLGMTPRAGSGLGGAAAEGTHPPPPGPASLSQSWVASPLLAAFQRVRDRSQSAPETASAEDPEATPVPTQISSCSRDPPQGDETARSQEDGAPARPDPRSEIASANVNQHMNKHVCICGGLLQAIFVSRAAGTPCADCGVTRKHGARAWRCGGCSCYRCPGCRQLLGRGPSSQASGPFGVSAPPGLPPGGSSCAAPPGEGGGDGRPEQPEAEGSHASLLEALRGLPVVRPVTTKSCQALWQSVP